MSGPSSMALTSTVPSAETVRTVLRVWSIWTAESGISKAGVPDPLASLMFPNNPGVKNNLGFSITARIRMVPERGSIPLSVKSSFPRQA